MNNSNHEREKVSGLLEEALNTLLKKKYSLNILFGDATKNPHVTGWNTWCGSEQQTDTDIKAFYDKRKDAFTNYGFAVGHSSLIALDFDWEWVYHRAQDKHLSILEGTFTKQTPNGGYRVLVISLNYDRNNSKYKNALRFDIFGEVHYAACYGEALKEDGTIGEYKPIYEDNIKTVDSLNELEAFLEDTLKLYDFLTYPCISSFFEKHKKWVHLTHEQRLAICNLMLQKGISVDEAQRFFMMCKDNYDKTISRQQCGYTKQRIKNGVLKPQTCETLKDAFGYDGSKCQNCSRKKEKYADDESSQSPQAHSNTFYFLDKLSPKTTHLIQFHELDNITGLYGKDYVILKKALWYSLIGAIAPQKIVKLGDIYTDVRFNPCFPIPSGAGKKGLATTIEEIITKMGRQYQSPTSLHPEQLVGKVIKRKKGKEEEYIENFGYLKLDFFLLDDANNLLTARETNYEESRRYICKALDPIGRNMIYKRLVDNTPGESLSYLPECTIAMCIQPTYLPEDVIAGGLMRRFMPIYVPLFGTMVDREDEFHARLYANKDHEELINKLRYFYKQIIDGGDNEFTFSDNAIAEIEKSHKELIAVAKNHSEKGRNYTDRVAFPLQDTLVSMACIQALSCFRTGVNEFDVQLAYMDLFEFYASTLDYVNQKVLGLLDYGETWRGATSTDAKCLEYLFKNGALSKEESTIAINEYIEFIAKLRNIETRSAERDYYRHVSNGWIESKRIGQHDSIVWLTFTPKTNNIINPKAINLEETEYFRIWNNLDKIGNIKNDTHCGVADSADLQNKTKKLGEGTCDNCGNWVKNRVFYNNDALCKSCHGIEKGREEDKEAEKQKIKNLEEAFKKHYEYKGVGKCSKCGNARGLFENPRNKNEKLCAGCLQNVIREDLNRSIDLARIEEEDYDGFDGYTDVQPLDEPQEHYCEKCEESQVVSFKAEKDGHAVSLCDNEGRALDRHLYGNGGRF